MRVQAGFWQWIPFLHSAQLWDFSPCRELCQDIHKLRKVFLAFDFTLWNRLWACSLGPNRAPVLTFLQNLGLYLWNRTSPVSGEGANINDTSLWVEQMTIFRGVYSQALCELIPFLDHVGGTLFPCFPTSQGNQNGRAPKDWPSQKAPKHS